MKKEYWFVIITYIAMQLSSIVGMPIFMLIGSLSGMPADELKVKSAAYWIVFSFLAALFTDFIFDEKRYEGKNRHGNQASISLRPYCGRLQVYSWLFLRKACWKH